MWFEPSSWSRVILMVRVRMYLTRSLSDSSVGFATPVEIKLVEVMHVSPSSIVQCSLALWRFDEGTKQSQPWLRFICSAAAETDP